MISRLSTGSTIGCVKATKTCYMFKNNTHKLHNDTHASGPVGERSCSVRAHVSDDTAGKKSRLKSARLGVDGFMPLVTTT